MQNSFHCRYNSIQIYYLGISKLCTIALWFTASTVLIWIYSVYDEFTKIVTFGFLTIQKRIEDKGVTFFNAMIFQLFSLQSSFTKSWDSRQPFWNYPSPIEDISKKIVLLLMLYSVQCTAIKKYKLIMIGK